MSDRPRSTTDRTRVSSDHVRISARPTIVGVSALVALLALIVAACTPGASIVPSPSSPPSSPPNGSPSPSPSPASPSPSPASAIVVLRVTNEGGFINPAASIATLPTVTVYADGRIFGPGAVPAIYPGPLLPAVSVRSVGADGAAAIVAAIRAAGLDRPSTAGPGIPGDSGTTVFTVTLDRRTTVTRIAGLGGGPPGPGQPSQDPEAAAAADLLDRLLDPSDTWGAASVSDVPFTPSGYLVYAVPGAPESNDPSITEPEIAWPLPTPLATFGASAQPDFGLTGLRRGVVLGADAATLGPVLQRATAISPFSSGGSAWTLFVRPLLPDEAGG